MQKGVSLFTSIDGDRSRMPSAIPPSGAAMTEEDLAHVTILRNPGEPEPPTCDHDTYGARRAQGPVSEFQTPISPHGSGHLRSFHDGMTALLKCYSACRHWRCL